MKQVLIIGVTALLFTAATAQAACYADYKAKRDAPLQLHYGVIKLSDQPCSGTVSAQQIAARIAKDGWTLLNVLGTFDDSGLDRRRGNAGQFFLRY